jgi:hypothetical protein
VYLNPHSPPLVASDSLREVDPKDTLITQGNSYYLHLFTLFTYIFVCFSYIIVNRYFALVGPYAHTLITEEVEILTNSWFSFVIYVGQPTGVASTSNS